jgi:TRAP-type uncharacterized transport system substrate-binding protein
MDELSFAGSTVGEPWWIVGEVVAKILEPAGYAVIISDEPYGEHNVPWMASGRSQLGCTGVSNLALSLRHVTDDGGGEFASLRAIASIDHPSWHALAVRRGSGISSLDDIAAHKIGACFMGSGGGPGTLLGLLMEQHGFSLDELKSWGGSVLPFLGRAEHTAVRDGAVDVMFSGIYAGYTPHGRYWFEATMLHEMDFLDFAPGFIDRALEMFPGIYTKSFIPHNLFPGIDRDIAALYSKSLALYCRDDAPDGLVDLVVRGLDEQSELLMHTPSPLWYDRRTVALDLPLPLHPAAARYYESVGYALG